MQSVKEIEEQIVLIEHILKEALIQLDKLRSTKKLIQTEKSSLQSLSFRHGDELNYKEKDDKPFDISSIRFGNYED